MVDNIQFDVEPRLVHQILLTDPSDFDSLSSTTRTQTPTFSEFREYLLGNSDGDSRDPAFVLKRAYHDTILASIEQTQDLKPLYHLLLELHSAVRSLVPNREDLHSFLKDDRGDLPEVGDCIEIIPWLIQASQALAALESQVRAESTNEWMRMAHNQKDNLLSFMVTSLFYLIDKAELCSHDKKDFYLTHVLAPRIHSTDEGRSIERKDLHDRFGDKPPITKSWISSLLSSLDDDVQKFEDLRNNAQRRRDLIRKGWIQDILFQKDKQISMPEIFFFDVQHLHAIRNTTRIAAAGCALGYLACIAAKVDPEILLHQENKGQPLVVAMNNTFHESTEAYEQSIEDCIVSLAQSWKKDQETIDAQAIETLRGQTRKVLQGQSPVIKLLDDRMKTIFHELSTVDTDGVPQELVSGRGAPTSEKKVSTFVSRARTKFQERGLAFYALELAHASEVATKIANLACDLYAQDFLDDMILESMN